MSISNCKICRKLFNPVFGDRICPECKKKQEEQFQGVKKYIRENPKTSIEIVARDNDVSIKQIKQWVREERLIFDADSNVGIECESCGKMIRTGRFCEMCKTEMSNEMRSAIDVKPITVVEPKKKKDSDRMHYLQK